MSDMIVLFKKRKTEYSLYRDPIPLENCLILDIPDIDKSGLKKFAIVHLRRGTHMIQCNSSGDKALWLKNAESHRAHFCSVHRTMEREYLALQSDGTVSQEHSSPLDVDTLFSLRGVLHGKRSTVVKGSRTENASMEVVTEETLANSPKPDKKLSLRTNGTDSDLDSKPSTKKGYFMRQFASLTGLNRKKTDENSVSKSLEQLY